MANGLSSLPKLMVPRVEAERKIRVQIEKGREIGELKIGSELSLKEARAELDKWSKYNRELLARLFDNASIVEEYDRSTSIPFFAVLGELNITHEIEDFRNDIGYHTRALESILERLELIPEPGEQPVLGQNLFLGSDIFVVHGHDEAAKQSVARFIERLGLHAVILHEQPNAGRTIIQKFEDYSNAGFAVVLLTPDDMGFPQDRPEEKKPRTRQNVIFELGYFIGKLGRNRVCALYKEGVEIPSDFEGVLYVSMDAGGGWQLTLAREIKHAGIEVDLNKVL